MNLRYVKYFSHSYMRIHKYNNLGNGRVRDIRYYKQLNYTSKSVTPTDGII